jgi:hypothetical protein
MMNETKGNVGIRSASTAKLHCSVVVRAVYRKMK